MQHECQESEQKRLCRIKDAFCPEQLVCVCRCCDCLNSDTLIELGLPGEYYLHSMALQKMSIDRCTVAFCAMSNDLLDFLNYQILIFCKTQNIFIIFPHLYFLLSVISL